MKIKRQSINTFIKPQLKVSWKDKKMKKIKLVFLLVLMRPILFQRKKFQYGYPITYFQVTEQELLAVPGHDERDYEFAKFKLQITQLLTTTLMKNASLGMAK